MPIIGVIASSMKGAPGIPTIGTATDVGTSRAYNNGAATVTFTPAAGATATSFTATSSPGGFTGSGASSPVTVAGLQSGVAYTFTVTATNASGTSAASAASNSITATTVPQAPTIGTATDGGTGTTVSVAFTGNATGGKAISTYTATSSPSSLTGTNSSSPITVSGLTAGTAYTFTVTATNANGTSAASAASNSVTPALPPAFDSIATISGNGTSTSLVFNSIPSTYRHLQLRYWARENTAGNNLADLRFAFNSGGSYYIAGGLGNGATWALDQGNALTSGRFTNSIVGSGYTANYISAGYIDIYDYATTDKLKVSRGVYGEAPFDTTYVGTIGLGSFTWDQTSAITSLTITTAGTVAFTSTTRFMLYGIKET